MKKVAYLALAKTIGFYLNILSFVLPKKSIQKAYSLFSIPRTGKLTKETLPDILKEAVLETLELKSENIQTYTWKGDENVILLVHGWESNSSRWARLISELKKTGHTIVTLDAPGHGLSGETFFSIPKYVEFINVAVEKFQPKFLIGHSMGGKACLYYQYLHQNSEIQKIILLGAPCDFSIIFDNYISLLSLNSIVSKGLKKHYIKHFNLEIEHFSGRIFASNISTKGLIIHDIDDKVVLFNEGKKLAKYWKTATFIETKGLGHSLHDADLYQKITQFIIEEDSTDS